MGDLDGSHQPDLKERSSETGHTRPVHHKCCTTLKEAHLSYDEICVLSYIWKFAACRHVWKLQVL